MTVSSAADLELRLATAYEHQLQRYREALNTAETILVAFEAGHDATRELEQLQTSLDQISQLDGPVRQLRGQWDNCGSRPGTRLRGAVEGLEQILKQLIGRIHCAEQLARQARERLVPQLNQEARGQQMRAAYSGDI